ncbi:MAG: tRNA (guanosine(46)-N7)-methyltransferase TrmB [Desulfuromonadaceae bacterium GWC2_58_13]|nr:MAG: tRNA (guanosine(46)-N7)-methyltransferase TrmB [Desulfuromonadaceae bacterium GWC2_58_13]
MTQRVIEITSPFFIPRQCLEDGASLNELFEKNQPLALEIGCGIGDFIIQRAEQQPEINFLAIDIYNKGCYKTCNRIEMAGLTNVRVMRIEARYLLTHFVAPDSLTAVYINCPDPWPKKRHRSRRLINRDFVQTLLYYLKPGGDFYFSTDFDDYGEAVADLMPTVEGYGNVLVTGFARNLPDYPLSKYMRRFLQKGQDIYFVHYRKKARVRPEALLRPAIDPGFRVRWSRAENE